MWFSKKIYLSWPEYSKKIEELEMIRFISSVTLKSAGNNWKKFQGLNSLGGVK